MNGWLTVYVDGGIDPKTKIMGAAAVASNGDGRTIVETSSLVGEGTSNQAEYQAALIGARLGRLLGASRLEIVSDSLLLVQQTNLFWAIINPELGKLHGKLTWMLQFYFDDRRVRHVPREQNKRADWLVNELLRPGKRKEPK